MHSPFHLTDDDVRHLGEGEILQQDDFASTAEVETWSASITSSDDAFTSAHTGGDRRQDATVRSDRTAWACDLPGRFTGLHERFVEVRTELNDAAWMGLDAFDIQLATYASGGHYDAHRDALRGDSARRVTAILYLNPDWQADNGGCLRVHTLQGHRDVEPKGGRLVVFLSSHLLHEVRPGRAVRHAATAWFRGRGSLG